MRWGCRMQDPNQYDDLDEVDRRSDVRLLDSLIMTVQLNVRKLLQVRYLRAGSGRGLRMWSSQGSTLKMAGIVVCPSASTS